MATTPRNNYRHQVMIEGASDEFMRIMQSDLEREYASLHFHFPEHNLTLVKRASDFWTAMLLAKTNPLRILRIIKFGNSVRRIEKISTPQSVNVRLEINYARSPLMLYNILRSWTDPLTGIKLFNLSQYTIADPTSSTQQQLPIDVDLLSPQRVQQRLEKFGGKNGQVNKSSSDSTATMIKSKNKMV